MAKLTGFTLALRTPDLRKKLIFTLGVVALFRFGSTLPAPSVSAPDVRYCSGLESARGPTADIYAVLKVFEIEQVYLTRGIPMTLTVAAVVVALVALVVFMEQAQRRIPVRYAKRMTGRRGYGGTPTYLPVKVNQAGVVPVITPARAGPVALRLGSYTLTLPDRYHLSDAAAPACAATAVPGPRRPDRPQAAAAPGVCVMMFLTPSFSPGQADPNVPRGATEITVGHGRAWLVPGAQGRAALVVAGDAVGGQVRDVVIGASGLSQAALVSLVSDGLKAA